MIRTMVSGLAVAASLLLGLPAVAQEGTAPDTLIVLDASGSMWGQIDGRTKIDIARETLSSVLSETSPAVNIGLIAYGHRVRGQCSDIETLVPMGPAQQTVPRIIEAARQINPKGMTPLSDAVRKAAEEMLYTERAATVVLVTDGVETCDADPCALGTELAAAGIDFTAHVVGFGLSGEEGRQVACLADNTGGRYIAAVDAEELVDALRETIAPDDSDFTDDDSDFTDEPTVVATPRVVEFEIRDAAGGPVLKANNVEAIVEPLDGGAIDSFRLWHHQKPISGEGTFSPGKYELLVNRTANGVKLRGRFPFEVVPGPDPMLVEGVLAAHLKVSTVLYPGNTVPHGGTVMTANMTDNGKGVYDLIPVVDGALDEASAIRFSNADIDATIPPGTYLLRGTFARTITREKLITLGFGENLEIDFDFGLAEVVIDYRDADGFPAEKPTTAVYDDAVGGKPFATGGDIFKGERTTWYLPVGTWRLNTGPRGGGEARAEILLELSHPGERITLMPTAGMKLSDADVAAMADEGRVGCLGFRGTAHGKTACVVEEVDLSDVAEQGAPPPEEMQPEAPQPEAAPPSGGSAGFSPVRRYDFVSMTTMRPAVSVGFLKYDGQREAGKVLLREGWCGDGCPVEVLDIVAPWNAEERLYKGGMIFAVSKAKGPLALRSEETSPGVLKLEILAATGDFMSDEQTVGESFAMGMGRQVDSASAKGFETAMEQPEPAPEPEPAPSPAVEPPPPAPTPGGGAGDARLDAIPPGIYAMVEREAFDPADPDDITHATRGCVQLPFVSYADGHVEMKEYSADAAMLGYPYRPAMAGECRSAEGVVQCDVHAVDAPETDKFTRLFEVTALADGHARLIDRDSGRQSTLFACVRPGGPMSATETLPDGATVIDHIMRRDDGGPVLAFADDGTYLGPREVPSPEPPVAPIPAGDFAPVAGLYGEIKEDQFSELELYDACYFQSLVLYRDGFAHVSKVPPGLGPEGTTEVPVPFLYMMCGGDPADASCNAYQGRYPHGRLVPQPIGIKIAGDVLDLCLMGDCRRMRRCPNPRAYYAEDPPAPDGRPWIDHVLERPDGGPGVE